MRNRKKKKKKVKERRNEKIEGKTFQCCMYDIQKGKKKRTKKLAAQKNSKASSSSSLPGLPPRPVKPPDRPLVARGQQRRAVVGKRGLSHDGLPHAARRKRVVLVVVVAIAFAASAFATFPASVFVLAASAPSLQLLQLLQLLLLLFQNRLDPPGSGAPKLLPRLRGPARGERHPPRVEDADLPLPPAAGEGLPPRVEAEADEVDVVRLREAEGVEEPDSGLLEARRGVLGGAGGGGRRRKNGGGAESSSPGCRRRPIPRLQVTSPNNKADGSVVHIINEVLVSAQLLTDLDNALKA